MAKATRSTIAIRKRILTLVLVAAVIITHMCSSPSRPRIYVARLVVVSRTFSILGIIITGQKRLGVYMQGSVFGQSARAPSLLLCVNGRLARK
jgi:H+/gluconate symporter-like permease